MAYKIILPMLSFIQHSILDFIDVPTLKVIDCNTTEGQLCYIRLFGQKAFNKRIKPYIILHNQEKLIGEIILSTNLIQDLFLQLSERARRLVAGFLYLSVKVRKKTDLINILGLDRKTAQRGAQEVITSSKLDKQRIRKSGAGRKSKISEHSGFLSSLESIAEDHMAGDPMSEKRAVRKSLKHLKKKLQLKGIKASESTIRKYLRKLKISLKGNVKTISKTNEKKRNQQFNYINKKRKKADKAGIPVISVDTKKKENIGLFKMTGKLWRKIFKRVFAYDFPSLGQGKMTPYGIYDIKQNKGYMYCGITPDTPKLAVTMISRWWKDYGRFFYPNSKELVILCDGGGSNGYRVRGWKYELYNQLAVPYNLTVRVCHYPTGCSKYNPIERKLFSYITINWAGEPLESVEKALAFINGTTTEKGLIVQGFKIEETFPKGIKYTDQQMDEIRMRKMRILPKWNYAILPQ